jgi:hypothetical protein
MSVRPPTQERDRDDGLEAVEPLISAWFVGELPCSFIGNAVLSRRIPAAMSCRAALEPSTPAAATAAGRDAQPGAATLMLVLTIGWAATATPAALPPIEVLPVPAVYAPSTPEACDPRSYSILASTRICR